MQIIKNLKDITTIELLDITTELKLKNLFYTLRFDMEKVYINIAKSTVKISNYDYLIE